MLAQPFHCCGWIGRCCHARRQASVSRWLRRLVSLLTQEGNVRLANHSGLLHCLTQVRRSGKRLRLLQIVACKQQHDLVWIVNAAQQVLFPEASRLARRSVSIVCWLPLGKVSDFVPNKYMYHGFVFLFVSLFVILDVLALVPAAKRNPSSATAQVTASG